MKRREELERELQAENRKAQEEELRRNQRDFAANLLLMRKRSEEKRNRWLNEHQGWKAWGVENIKHLERAATAREIGREMANAALKEEQEAEIKQEPQAELPFFEALAQQARENSQEEQDPLDEPISKARDVIRGYGYFQGNYYGLTSGEAPFYGKPKSKSKSKKAILDRRKIKIALTAKGQGESYDEKVVDTWHRSDVKQLHREMERPSSRFFKFTMKKAWKLLPEGQCEPKPSREDEKVVMYVLEYLNFDGVKRRLRELLG